MVDVLTASALTIRPLRYEELSTLAEAIEEMSEAQFRNRWREQELGFREVLVAELDGELVGNVSVREGRAHSLHLFALEVAPSRRSRGIGGEIVRYVVDEARRRGLQRVFLEVRVDNPARRLYHRLGFRRVGPAFVNTWFQFGAEGQMTRMDELSYRMVKRVRPAP